MAENHIGSSGLSGGDQPVNKTMNTWKYTPEHLPLPPSPHKGSEFKMCLFGFRADCLQCSLQVWEGHWWVQLWPVSERGPLPEPPQQVPLPVRCELCWRPLWDRCKRPLLFCLFAPVAESLSAPLLSHSPNGWWASSRVGWSGRLLSSL